MSDNHVTQLPGETLAKIIRVMNACRTRIPKRIAAYIIAEATRAASDEHTDRHGAIDSHTIVVTTKGAVAIDVVSPADGRVAALGAALYEMVCGERPAPGETSVMAFYARQDRLSSLTDRKSDVDAVLDGIIGKALGERDQYPTEGALAADLDAYARSIGEMPSSADLAKLMLNTFGARYVATLEQRAPVAKPIRARPAAPEPAIIATVTPPEPAPAADAEPAPPAHASARSSPVRRGKLWARQWLYALAASLATLAMTMAVNAPITQIGSVTRVSHSAT